MANQIHGHAVMEMMMETGEVYTRSSLRSAIVAKFGEDTRFYTCSAEQMTAEELIVFLEGRDKFVEEDGGFTTAPEKVCNH